MDNRKFNYTTINHNARKELGLSMNEYAVADLIFHLSQKEGYCYSSREWMGNELGMHKANIIRIIDRLKEEGVVENGDNPKKIKTTMRWFDTVVAPLNKTEESCETLPEKLRNATESCETLPPSNNNNTSNNIYNSIFALWNEKKIFVHRSINDKIKRAIGGKLRDKYTLEDICQAINNYATILQDDKYYWNYKWTLNDFLQRGFEKFLDFDVAEKNYLREKKEEERLPDGDYYNPNTKTYDFWKGGKIVKSCKTKEEYVQELRANGQNVLDLKPKEGASIFKPPTYEEIQEQIKKGERKVWDF